MGEGQIEGIVNSNLSMPINVGEFIFDSLITIALALALSKLYVRYAKTLSNRKSFAYNFVLLSFTTMLIITVVKTSLALSLGLVGALSIVRFRSAIKDPEELLYLFFSIAIGIGLGANQRIITIISFFIYSIFTIFRSKLSTKKRPQIVNLVLYEIDYKNDNLENLINLILKYTSSINLSRISKEENLIEMALQVNIDSFDEILKIKNNLKEYYPNLNFEFIDTSGLISDLN